MKERRSTMFRAALFVVTALIILTISPSIRNLIGDSITGVERYVIRYGPYSYVLGIAGAVTTMYALAKSAVR